jgi:uncharacterized protein (DUF427 family)
MGVSSDEHPITIVSNSHRVRVIQQGVTLYALTLQETGLAPVQYSPRADVNMARLMRSEHRTHCPYKGDASYFHLRTEDGVVENAAWSYEEPFDAPLRATWRWTEPDT